MLTIAFRAVPRGQDTVESGKSASATRNSIRGIAAGITLTASLFAASAAQAQNCGAISTPFGNPIGVFGSAVSAGATISSAITAANTAFLTQSTAFVSAPANPQPGQEGGGVWVRGVGGELDLKSSSAISGTTSAPLLGIAGNGGTTCATKFHESYGGVQVGSDVARLNLDGWNVHLGTTAGAIWSSGNIVGGSPTDPTFGPEPRKFHSIRPRNLPLSAPMRSRPKATSSSMAWFVTTITVSTSTAQDQIYSARRSMPMASPPAARLATITNCRTASGSSNPVPA